MSETPTPTAPSPPTNNELIEEAKKVREKYEKDVDKVFRKCEDDLRALLIPAGRTATDYERYCKIFMDQAQAWFLKP